MKDKLVAAATKLAAVVAVPALGLALTAVPAQAAQDTNLSGFDQAGIGSAASNSQLGGQGSGFGAKTIGNQKTLPAVDAPKDAMPDNPSQKLPDKVSAAVPDDATVVSKDLAVTKDGQVKNVETGKPVTDPKVVGTKDKPADPLAKTDGKRFIPVEADKVKQAVEKNGGDANATDTANSGSSTNGNNGANGGSSSNSNADSSASSSKVSGASDITRRKADKVVKTGKKAKATSGSVRNVALQNNQYGAYWGHYNGTPAFFEAGGNLFAQQAKGVIDVSQWQGTINWQAVKNSGVEGAIIRLSFGWGNGYDSQARRNINECKRLGIPFGVYIYSYAYDGNTGAAEGNDTASLLRNAGVNPGDLSYPVFYDLEGYAPWSGHYHPNDSGTYDGIVNNWWWRMQANGYNNLSVYSYTAYLNGPLNSYNIRSSTRWVASYGARTGFGYSTNDRGWQYADNGSIGGISGSVDINAFGNYNYSNSGMGMSAVAPQMSGYQAAALPNDTYYISSSARDSAGLDIPNGSSLSGTKIQLYDAIGSKAQQYKLTRHRDDGSYEIQNVNSGKVLDISGAQAYAGAPVQQWDANGSDAQRWYLRNAGKGGMYIQSKLGNFVLDLPNASTRSGTKLQLWDPNLTRAQQFIFSTISSVSGGNKRIRSLAGNVVLDVPGAALYDTARLQVYDWNNTDAQKYTFNWVGNGIYEIRNSNSGKAVDLGNANTANGAMIDQYAANGTCAQHWALREQSSGQYAFYTTCAADKAIDIPGGNATRSQKVQLYDGNGTYAQRWAIETVKTRRQMIDELAAAHRSDLTDGTYVIGSKYNNWMVLDVSGAAWWDSARVQLYSNNGTGAQRWRVSHDGAGYITFTNVSSGKVLDINSAQDRPGVSMQQYSSNGTYAQKWIAVKDGNAFKLVSALDSGLVLDIYGAGMFNGNTVQTYNDNGTVVQRWVALHR
ncbi:RICIN domain-containing protein [Bifidobacterium sp. ESL0800]|uniref:RICIN domain-containing protein n=1 Tax=Bifidobacterium sp. ESL0800 TaxID=2983236 RepID=UPI0023F9BAB3|nr:RICIN domain-containing protein [Bifidobacterium sp. ESL0800]WEV75233.1 RICIN domain-containing protein [Bifidobacterium sp. ESL0800]